MAIDAPKSMATSTDDHIGVKEIAASILAPLASLKLTVFLLVMGVAVTLIATLDQVNHDIWDVKAKHFENAFVEVPFQTFFVERWAPNYQNVPGSFYVPSGFTILAIMLINLAAAHILRFRLQAKGARLGIGIIATILAALLTWAIIFNNQNPDGFQATPPISWEKMWVILQIAVLGIACAAGFGAVTITGKRMVERILLSLAAIACGGVLVMTLWLGDSAFIGESAMRILWQLAQSTIAAAAALVASVLLFRRKAGIVLLHIGIAGLMANEIYVTTTNNEQRMTIQEGETVSSAVDIRSTELAIIDTSDDEFDEIVTVPMSRLVSGDKVSDDELPFDVECLRFLPNSDVRKITASFDNPATKGIGTRYEAFDVKTGTGIDTNQMVDFASAYVKFKEKGTGKLLGTHLISQNFGLKNADTVTVGKTDYRIDLRFKTDYKSFSMTLKDVKAEYYVGTETPRWFSSQVVLNDREKGITSDQEIWMNNPLRFANETFYQSSLGTLPGGTEYTVLQVVTNRGWMIPYVCCMFTVLGLTWQFGASLLAFLEKRRKQEIKAYGRLQKERSTSAGLLKHPVTARSKWGPWIPAVLLVGLFGFYSLGEIYKSTKPIEKDGMRLDLLGQIPMTKDGRVQPLDSFARNTARQLAKREEIFDGNDKKQPAIRWLADTVFEAPGYRDYQVFRIEDPTVISALDLSLSMPTLKREKNRFRYTLDELLDVEPKLMELLPNPSEKREEEWTVFEKRLGGVATKLQRVFAAKLTFGRPEPKDDNLVARLETAGRTIESPKIPLIVPRDDTEKPWGSFLPMQNQAWISTVAKRFGATDVEQLSKKIISDEILPPLRDDMLRARVIERLSTDKEFLKLIKKDDEEIDAQQIAQMMQANWDQFPKEILKEMEASEGPMVDAMLEQQIPRFQQVMAEQIAKINMGSSAIEPTSELNALLLKLRPAYLDGDTETFNSSLEEYLAGVSVNPPAEMVPYRIGLEYFYNGFAPFYLAMVIYLVAFVVGSFAWATFPWAGARKSIDRAAFWLLVLGLSIHITGIVLRVLISGRPPVTNLYSSAIFVSAGFVFCMLFVERLTKLGIGNVMAANGAFAALTWAWTMSIVDGDTFAVLVAVLDTQFWLSTHVVCISIGYVLTLVAGFLGLAYVVAGLVTPALHKENRKMFADVIYGIVCFGLLTSFFGTVLGGLWADDSWGRFWGWDPKENGALMIVLWNAVVLHARWGGMVRGRGIAGLAIIGNLVTLWSWKGVNSMGVGLHAYSGTEDATMAWIVAIGFAHLLVLGLALIPTTYWMSHAAENNRETTA